MECNKEEAIRAKGIAENKMHGKDFVGARKIVLKAQQLFPDLENVSQMLTVCEVHCSAGNVLSGETDWYGILQVEPASDELTIKKQYRKLALLLHPDKNKFAGAEAAFKLVGEAHRTLSDKAKRALHDMKRGVNFQTVSLRQPTHPPKTSCTRRQPGIPNNATNKSFTQFNGSNQQQAPPSSSAPTFWTICPFCGIRYQYYRTILNRSLRCQNCMQPFIAYDLNEQAVPRNPTGIPQQKFRGPGAHMASQKGYFGNTSSHTGFQGDEGGRSTSSQPWSRFGVNTELGDGSKSKVMEDCKVDKEVRAGNEVKFEKVKLQEVNKGGQVPKSSVQNARQKRSRNIVVESNNSEASESDEVVVKGGHPSGQNVGTTGSYPRRSPRQKQNVSYQEDGNVNDNFVRPFKRLRKVGTSNNANQSDSSFFVGDSNGIDVRINRTSSSLDKKDDKQKEIPFENKITNCLQEREREAAARAEGLINGVSSKANNNAGSCQKTTMDPDSVSYPDPEFFDFEKERDPTKFAVDQIWAVYDDFDGMPRFYARIRNVYGPDFKLRFTWLEHDPMGKAEMEGSEEDSPVACGNFRLGKSEYTKEQLMFSHPMPWEKGTRRNSYDIYPRKGEVWALFKDSDVRWSSDSDSHRIYDYEVVEVLSDFDESSEITVVRLVKINGFVSLFMRAIDKGLVPLGIPRSEVLRFSHRIPSYRMKGEEREGVPAGSFELDTAALPTNFEETCATVSLESTKVKVDGLDNALQSKSLSEEDPSAGTTKVSDTQLEEKNVHESQGSGDQSTNGLNGACEKEQIRAQDSISEAREHVETPTMESQVDGKDENVDARVFGKKNASEQHDPSRVPSPGHIFEYPDPEFHDFEEARSCEKFERGQIWALYSEIDRCPKYYARIKKVDVEGFRVHITWLQSCPRGEEEKRWLDKDLPASCGTFKVMHGETSIFDTTDTFSHLVRSEPTGRRDHYSIYPSTGEVWALYKNWSAGWSLSDLETCEYDVVVILDRSDSGIRAFVLRKVGGCRAVFMSERSTVEIPAVEYLRFSHQIPAFRLTEERGGKLRGYWELDPASLPEVLLFVN